MIKLTLEGWIRSRLEYDQTDLASDPNRYYFDHHEKFNFGDEYTTERLKFKEFVDQSENLGFQIFFSYNEIGIRFALVSRENDETDRLAVFNSFLERVVKAYRNFKEYFVDEICPSLKGIEFKAERLIIISYGFFKGLSSTLKKELQKKMKSTLEEYSSNVRLVLMSGKSRRSPQKIEITSLLELEKQARQDFYSITMICDEIYLFVKHHLYARYFIFEDPSLSVLTVGQYGFLSSLRPQDIYYELELLNHDKNNFNAALEKMKKACFPMRLDRRRKELLVLEKRQATVADDLKETINLSNAIYDGLKESDYSDKIWGVLESADSLPHSLDQAYAMLELNKLGRFSSLMRDLQLSRNELDTIEAKLSRTRLYITFSLLGALGLLVSIIKYLGFEIGFIADFLQILTFVVAILLLLIKY